MQLKTPIFSIILPTCNRPHMLSRAIDSVLKQTFSDFELIIVDDSGKKGEQDVINFSAYHNIKLIKNITNMGVAQARNVGMKAAKGKYISFLDDDDEYLPSFLANTFKILENTPPEVALSFCGVTYIDYYPDTNIKKRERIRNVLYPCKNTEDLFVEFLSVGTGFGITLKAECIKKIGYFDEMLKIVEDTDYFFRFLANGFIPIILPSLEIIMHNHHEVKLSSIATHKKRIEECRFLLERYKSFFIEYPRLRKQLSHHINNLENELTTASII